MRLIIKGAYGEGNFGDDALLYTMVTKLQSNGFDNIVVVCNEVKPYYSMEPFINDIPIFESFDQLVIDESEDVLIFGGGTQFYFFKKQAAILNKIKLLITQPTYYPKKIKSLLFGAKNVKKLKHIFFGVGIGPFETNGALVKFQNFIVNEDINFFIRDYKSLDFLPKQKRIMASYADMCFSLDVKCTKHDVNRIKDSYKVGIIYRDWGFSDELNVQLNHEELMKVHKNCDIEYILLGNDLKLKKKLTSLGANIICWDPIVYSMNDFLEKIVEYDFIFSARYHGVIFSMLAGVPCAAITLEPKLEIITTEYPSIQKVGVNSLAKCLSGVLTKLEYLAIENEKSVIAASKKSDLMFSGLFELLNKLEKK
jgi:polysaccharide pyruvyl transferase WcaK-like protein